MDEPKRVVFLDYLRVIACLMVMLVHACEQYYFGSDGGLYFASKGDAQWVVGLDSAVRACVPLFVMASSFLLFPVTHSTGEFIRRRLLRVFVPFAFWSAVYVWRFDGNPVDCLFNFPMATGGHLWFVPMLIGLYLLMPLLSPWAERVTEKELRGWLVLWAFTTTFPYLRKLSGIVCGAPSFGVTPYLYGECPWNEFGTFQFVSGFYGYMLLGLYFRKFVSEISWKRTLSLAAPLWLVGYALVALPFYFRIPGGGVFPVTDTYAKVVDLEISWMFCSAGVALTVIAYFLVLRKLNATGWFYERVIRPLSEASYGTYLIHILVLVEVAGHLKGVFTTPAAIAVIAVFSFVCSSAASLALRKIPRAGKYLA